MKVHVKKVDISSEDVIIDFSCEYGEAEAYWGTKPLPKAGADYEVELDITDELIWGKEVRLSKDKGFNIHMENEIYLTGIIEKVYKDGIADFRLGKSLIQLELDGSRIPMGEYVTIKASSIEMYEINY